MFSDDENELDSEEEVTIDPKEGFSEGIANTQEISKKAGVNFLNHIPSIG